jgi:hypothetical protein
MTPRTHTPPAIRPGLIKVGAYDVRIRPHRGVSTPPWIWDVLITDERTGQPITVASFCSWPDEGTCATAISNHRAKRSVEKVVAEATARAQHDLHRYAGRVSTDGSVRPVRNGHSAKPRPSAPPEREVGEVDTAAPDAPAARAIRRRGPRRDWTPAEDDILRRYYGDGGENGKDIARRLPGRSVTAIYQRIQKLDLRRGKGRHAVDA